MNDIAMAILVGLQVVNFFFATVSFMREREARRLLALARGVGEYGLGKEWVRDYEVFMGLPKETT